MEVVYKKLGIKIVAEEATTDVMIIQKICSILENLPDEIRSKIAKAIIKPDFYFAADLYKEGKITLGKFSEILGLSLHDSAKLLDAVGIKVDLGPSTKEELEKEIRIAKEI